jgi:hypothetical protein
MSVFCTANPCPTILSSTCVFYEGGNLIYTGILTNDNLQIALEKIDQKFQDAGLGYIFDNALTQTTPGAPVELGGPLIQDTIITSGPYNFTITGNIFGGKFATIGGNSSQFVKGDGSLDATSYQPAGNYITALTGDGTASGPGSAIFTLSNTSVIANTYGSSSQVPVFTVDSKGRITGVTNTGINYPAQLILISGDVTGAGLTGANVTLTLNTVNTGVFPAITPLKFSVNGKGLVTGASALTNLDLDTIYGYTPVPNTRTLTINGVTQDLSINRTWTIPVATGTVTSVGVTAGTGISASVSNPTTTPNITITNTAPDKIVSLSPGTGISVTGTYPNFTITNTGTAITPAALTKVDDTNVTLTLGGSPSTALLAATSLTLGWTGTLADSRIASAATWNAKQDAISLTTTGTSGAATFIGNTLNIPQYQAAGTYVTSVGATSPITSSGGSTPTISTSMSTNKLIGRSTAGVGVMEEITVGTGLTLSSGTLSSNVTGIGKGTAAGTDTYTTTISGVASYADGDAYLIRFTNGNTTGCTLNINGLGARTLYRNNDGALIGGDIVNGAEMLCVYNSTLNGFQTIGTAPNTLLAYVTNADSVTITKGQAVYAFGGTGDRMSVKLANNTSDATSAQTVGLVASTSIAANQKGLIMMQGLLDNLSILPTSTYNDGDPIYLGATAGSITKTKPYAPNHLVYLGVVTTASNGNAGRMYVRVQNGYELDELHNVQAQTPAVNDVLYYFGGSPGQWKTASISSVLGYTPQAQLNGTGFVKATGTTISYDNSTYFVLPSLTSGSVLFSNGTTIAQNNSNFFWDNTNTRLGIGTTSPISKLNIQTDAIGVSQTDAMGIALVNTTAATSVLNQNSPGLVFQSAAWKTTATAASRQSNWRIISTPATDSSEIEGRLSFQNAVDGGAYAASPPYFYRDRFGQYGLSVANATINAITGLASLSIAKGNPANSTSHLVTTGNFNVTSGTLYAIQNSVGYVPTSGTGVFNGIAYEGTINQTGGANGITRGLYLNPTLTAAANYRSIESTNGRVVLTDTISAGSGSLANSALSISQTWNTSGNPSAILLNVTNTASNAASMLMDLQQGGSSVFNVVSSTSRVNIQRSGGSPGIRISNTAVSNQFIDFLVSSNSAVISLGSGITGAPNFYIGNQGGFAAMGLTNGGDRNVRCVFGNNGSDVSGFYSTLMSSGNFNPGVGGSIFGSTTQYVSFHANPTINQASGTSITRGLYVNPTLTSASDFRGIDITNGSIVLPYTGQSATYAIKTSDYLVNCTSGTFTATLPTAVGCTGKNYIIKNSGTGAITVATTSSQTIDGSTTYSLGTQYKYVQVVSDGANWIITGNN